MVDIILFEKLRRGRPDERLGEAREIRFRLRFDRDERAFAAIEDCEGNRASDIDHRLYSGALRQTLRRIERIRERDFWRMDWRGQRASHVVYLDENPLLIDRLLRCGQLAAESGQTLRLASGLGQASVLIDDAEPAFACCTVIAHDGKLHRNPVFLSERHALVGERVIEIETLGERYREFRFFNARLPPESLEQSISLLFSNFENPRLIYRDYQLVSGAPIRAQPTLTFEKIGADEALYLRLGVSTPGFAPDFFAGRQVSRIATVRDMARQVVIRELIYESGEQAMRGLKNRLNRRRRRFKHKEGAGFCQEGNLVIVEKRLAESFIRAELPELIADYAIYGVERLKSYRVRAGAPTLRLQLRHGGAFLEGSAELDFGDQRRIPLADALDQYRRQGYMTLNHGVRGVVDREFINKLERLFKISRGQVSVSTFDLPLVEELTDGPDGEGPRHRAGEVIRGFNRLDEAPVETPDVTATLRPYQKRGYQWLRYLHDHALGGCLADDMGLGKTLQTLALLSVVYPQESRPSLVAAPPSLVFNWRREIQKFAPKLRVYAYQGPNRNPAEISRAQVTLTTYATIRNDIDVLKKTPFYYVILDESQNIKNPGSQTTRAVMALQGQRRLALSGTPVENNLSELFSLFRFLNPTMLGSFETFNRRYGAPIQKEGDKEAARELQRKIRPFLLRRLKDDVLEELPPKVEQTIYLDMSPEQKTFYEQRRVFYRRMIETQIRAEGLGGSQMFILQALAELRQIASIPEVKTDGAIASPKREALAGRLAEAVAKGHKALVFTNYLGAVRRIGDDLERAGIPFLAMTGATRNRQATVTRFQEDPAVKALVMTLKTGGVGLNLTQADYVFLFDPWWNRAAERQAVDRSHRIGQGNTVFTYRLIMRHSIEERILRLQEVKQKLFDDVIAADRSSSNALSEEDVAFILGDE